MKVPCIRKLYTICPFPVHKLSHMYIKSRFVFLVLHFYSLFFKDEYTWKDVNLFLTESSMSLIEFLP